MCGGGVHEHDEGMIHNFLVIYFSYFLIVVPMGD